MKHFVKQGLAVLLCVLMLAALSGCGDSGTGSGTTSATEPEPTVTMAPIDNVESKLPKAELSNKVVKVMTNATSLPTQVETLFQEQ